MHSKNFFQPTEIYGGACGILNTDYINKCDYDAAYDMLEHIHGPGLQVFL